MTLTAFLGWIFSSGGNALIASWIFERIPWYQSLESNVKQYVYFGAVFVLAGIAYAVLTYVPKEVLDAVAPWFGLLYTTFTAVFLGTAYHQVDKTNTTK